jgi:dehydrogenase/reductase SDR family protein 7
MMKGKVVWITGASSGIGEALAYAFARSGAKLVLSARRASELIRVKENCKMNVDDVLVLPLDIEHTETFAPALQTVLNRFGTIDVLVNNAGISQRSLVKETPLAVDKRLMDVNYLGTVALTKTVLPTML